MYYTFGRRMMLRMIPQICLQCGENTGDKSVQAEIKTPDMVNGYTIGFGKFTFTFCDIEHFMLWVTGLLAMQVARAGNARDIMMEEAMTTITTYARGGGDEATD